MINKAELGGTANTGPVGGEVQQDDTPDTSEWDILTNAQSRAGGDRIVADVPQNDDDKVGDSGAVAEKVYKKREPVPKMERLATVPTWPDGRVVDNTNQKLDALAQFPEEDNSGLEDAVALMSEQFPDSRYLRLQQDPAPRMNIDRKGEATVYMAMRSFDRSVLDIVEGQEPQLEGVDIANAYRKINTELGLNPDALMHNRRFMQAFVFAHEVGHYYDSLSTYNAEQNIDMPPSMPTISADMPLNYEGLNAAYGKEIGGFEHDDTVDRSPENLKLSDFYKSETSKDPETGVSDTRYVLCVPPQAMAEMFGQDADQVSAGNPRKALDRLKNHMRAIGAEQQYIAGAGTMHSVNSMYYRECKDESIADGFAIAFLRQNSDQFMYDASVATEEQMAEDDRLPYYPGQKTEVEPNRYEWLGFQAGRRMEITSVDADGTTDSEDGMRVLTLAAPLKKGEQLTMNFSGDVYDDSSDNIMQLGAIKKIDMVTVIDDDGLPSGITVVETEVQGEDGQMHSEFYKIAKPEDGIKYVQVESDGQKMSEVFGLHEGVPIGFADMNPKDNRNKPGAGLLSYVQTHFGALGDSGNWDNTAPASGLNVGEKLAIKNYGSGETVDLGTTQRIYQEGRDFFVQTDVSTYRVAAATRGSKYQAEKIIGDDELEDMVEEADI